VKIFLGFKRIREKLGLIGGRCRKSRRHSVTPRPTATAFIGLYEARIQGKLVSGTCAEPPTLLKHRSNRARADRPLSKQGTLSHRTQIISESSCFDSEECDLWVKFTRKRTKLWSC